MPEILPNGIVHGYPDEDAFLDSRAISNHLLDHCETIRAISLNDLQLLLYFAHGLHLMRTGKHLVYGPIEAGAHGPYVPSVMMTWHNDIKEKVVDPEADRVMWADDSAYEERKVAYERCWKRQRPNSAIRYRFLHWDRLTPDRRAERMEILTHPNILSLVEHIAANYAPISSSDLRKLACAPGTPWAITWARLNDPIQRQVAGVLGLRISDDLIRERFKFHKRDVSHQ